MAVGPKALSISYPMTSLLGCKCNKPPFSYLEFDTLLLGEDPVGAEVEVETCRKCGQKWLKYLVEEPHYSKSGRWWRIPLSNHDVATITLENARTFLEQQNWCFVGGSFYEKGTHKVFAPVKVT